MEYIHKSNKNSEYSTKKVERKEDINQRKCWCIYAVLHKSISLEMADVKSRGDTMKYADKVIKKINEDQVRGSIELCN